LYVRKGKKEGGTYEEPVTGETQGCLLGKLKVKKRVGTSKKGKAEEETGGWGKWVL